MDAVEARKIVIESFAVADEKAVLQVRTKLANANETTKTILSLSQGLKIEIS